MQFARFSRLAILTSLTAFVIACSPKPQPRTIPMNGGAVFLDDGGRGGVPVLFVTSAAGIGRFVIVGHSYAGAVVARYAADHPEKVAGVVYVDAAASALPLTKEQKDKLSAALHADKMRVVRTWFSPMLKSSAEAVQKEVFDSVEKTATDAFAGALFSLSDFDAKTLIETYHGPELAIAAADLETPAAFQKQFPEVEVIRISKAGHWLMLDKPEEVNAALDSFLATVR
jgi:pimeloyl-ACP methyl ester carboxylesterase